MKKKYHIKFFLLITILVQLKTNTFSQNQESLLSLVKDTKQQDSTRLKSLYKLIWNIHFDYPDSAIKLASYQLKLAQITNLSLYEWKAYSCIGHSYGLKNDYPKAMKFYLEALRIGQNTNDTECLAIIHNNIGLIYRHQLEYDNALKYFEKSKEFYKKNKDDAGLAIAYGNIANIYLFQEKYVEAIDEFEKALHLFEKENNEQGIIGCYSNLGVCYGYIGERSKEEYYYKKTIVLAKKINGLSNMSAAYINLSEIYWLNKDYKKALNYNDSAYSITLKVGDVDGQKKCNRILARVYEEMGDYRNAYYKQVEFQRLNDSIFNIENSELLSELKIQFELEKKETEMKAKADAEFLVINQEKRTQKWIIYFSLGILVIVLIFSFMLYKRYLITNKQKKIIEEKSKETELQKNIIEEKQKELVDSLNYSKRLQEAIIPPESEMKKYFKDYFILYEPKDIVAGDFYWLQCVDNYLFFAVADSTGHGVPGAIVSVVCSNALNRAVNEFGIRDTGKILDKTRELVIQTFEFSGQEINDGMDISLVRFDLNNKNNEVQWSGANNPLWYLSDNVLKIIKANKQPIGKTLKPVPFTSNLLNLHKGDILYLFTDGYADQFGGKKGKKFKYAQIKQKIIQFSGSVLLEQKKDFLNTFIEWKGNFEQVDDVTIAAIRI